MTVGEGQEKFKYQLTILLAFTCFEAGSHVAQIGLQFAMQLTLIVLPSAPLCWEYQCLLPCVVYAGLEI